MQTFDPVRFDAFVQLLAQPDPGDLPRRAHVYRWGGDPGRRARLPGLVMIWVQRRHLEHDIEEAPAPAMRALKRPARHANPGLRVLRPAGTS